MIYVKNIRYGLATNSSSSHSIVILKEGALDSGFYDNEFGWDFFTAGSKEAKMNYLGTCLRQTYQDFNKLPFEDADILASKKVGLKSLDEGYVDHQSVIGFPLKTPSYRQELHEDFLKAIIEAFNKDEVVILGGNDNTNEDHSLKERNYNQPSWLLGLQVDSSYNDKSPLIRYDQKYDYWTLFSNIRKVRFSFDDKDIVKSSVPDLVDLKITDYCGFGCDYCYQDSTPEGLHADTKNVTSIISSLNNMGVFEVAIGGGEPTAHPGFIKILESAKKNNITLNFTTKNYKWIKKNFNSIKDIVGAVGVSVDNLKDVKKIAKILKGCDYNSYYLSNSMKIVLHHPIGISSEKEIKEIISEAGKSNLDILFLGFKDVGRGEKFRLNSPEHNIDLVSLISESIKTLDYKMPNIGFDTLLIQQYKDTLPGISDSIFWTTKEGAFSMYIDAVENKAAKSSYEEADDFVNLTVLDYYKGYSEKEIIKVFESFQDN